MDERRTRLVALVQDLAFLDGGHQEAFTLASGRTSQWFFDMKPVMMHPEAGGLVADLILDHVEALGVDLLGGLELGAVPLTALVIARAGEMSALRGIMIRKEAKGRGGRKTQNPPDSKEPPSLVMSGCSSSRMSQPPVVLPFKWSSESVSRPRVRS